MLLALYSTGYFIPSRKMQQQQRQQRRVILCAYREERLREALYTRLSDPCDVSSFFAIYILAFLDSLRAERLALLMLLILFFRISILSLYVCLCISTVEKGAKKRRSLLKYL